MSEQDVEHRMIVHGRKQLTLAGVQHVDSFNESEIALQTNMGVLILKGEGLHITQLNLDTGCIEAEGYFSSFRYVENKARGKKLLGRILK